MRAPSISIVLADDHPVVIDGLARYLDAEPDLHVVAKVGSYAEASSELAATHVDVAVVDVNMPGGVGLSSVVELVERFPKTRFIVFSMLAEDTYALSFVQAGASAFLNKAHPPETLVAAIRAAHQGRRYLTPTLAKLAPSDGAPPTSHESLTARERQVFDRLITEMIPKQIAHELDLSASTVHTYIERIRSKLGLESTQAIVAYAFRHNLRA